jgi:hypothetical protein
MMMLYVRMRDKFMSGWGGARGKKSIYVVECETDEQATAILHAAEDRSEMVNISILSEKPVARANQVMTVRSFWDLGGPWHAYCHVGLKMKIAQRKNIELDLVAS